MYTFCYYLCHATLGKCTYIFLFLIYECGNLNAENKMWDMGKGTYLIVGNRGLVIRKFLKKRELEDACHQCTHYR